MRLTVIVALGVLSAAAAYPDVLTFPSDGSCSLNSAGTGVLWGCGNGMYVNQSYGDTAEADVTYIDMIRPGESLRWWNEAYNDLRGVVWGGNSDSPGGSYSRIEIAPVGDLGIRLNSFDAGAYPRETRNTSIRILDLVTDAVLVDYGTVAIGSGSTMHNTFTPLIFSPNGIAIEWRDTAYNVGLDNINFDAAAVQTPEPSTFGLIAGTLLLGWSFRRRS